ncbi:MAG: hypothetical protein COU09_03020 [Candidatus Harrisonbacteria bacterium CG10_big_fil_rev_8_21_14_0_10_44_23]|uniref:ATP-dependent helicase n=1 Tax=Candidatus Harrisonbacteria bacterium CG10_big_fil_rev_8_21_14_0_10_44_23 TaxID=1974585 RepID=A0A2H0UPJ8_9BACT|nr:MAG: hypothetical protein COU09_03020 [Candidatus Harrisonbacteria bacterium CG10_big_fil_rev_8_21_14_0_10_44_23]
MNPDTNFSDLGISPAILNVLEKLSFKTPTPIQAKAIPAAIEGKDLMGIAQTGTGKTLAFGIPMVQFALKGAGKGLIVLPTRELALQVFEALSKIGSSLGLKCAVLIGGEKIQRQIRTLRQNPHIIIGTPGRIIDHLGQKTLQLDKSKMLVLDEADRMLDMGFAPQLKKILECIPKERQTMLFSATMPEAIIRIAKSYMQLPVRVEIAPPGTAVKKITQELFFVSKQDKPRLLDKILNEYRGSVLIFIRTKYGVKKIVKAIRGFGHSAAEIHSNRSLNQRREALEGFKNGKYRVLVATDIAARGIDVQGITLVLNYDLPTNAQDYVHRIGRTGRAGEPGHAIAFATPEQKRDVREIEQLMRMTLSQSKLPELPPAKTPHFDQPNQSRGRRQGSSFHGRNSSSRSRRTSRGGRSRRATR